MTDHLHAEFAKLWTSAQTPPDVVKFLGSLANPSPKQIGAIVKLDQQCRWKTAAPTTVEDYLNAVGEWRNDQDVILEFTAGEFLARLDVQHLPHVGEYAARFPHLESQIRQKLSDLSTNGAGNTSMVASIRESLDRVFEIDDICDAFGRLWRESPTAPFIEAWVLHGRREERIGLLKELLRVELCVRVERKEAPTLQEYRQRFADESPFRDILNDWEQHPQQYMLTGVPSTKQVSPQEAGATLIGQFPVHSSQSGTLELDGSQRIGHFRLLKQLGRGTFGRVYRAHDEQLERAVAIKVPRRSRFRRPEDAEAYLAEARTVARLDHPGIVPVYQAGRSDDGAVYVVSRLIEGRSLEEVIKNQRPDHPTTAQLVAKVARALHFAHQHRVIHRDIKPANILIDDATGTPFVADFGLAMKEEDYLKQAGTLAGTPAYMSPEQARAEGHRLDGRSDLFALGVVLYELLTGKRPFRGSTANETLYQVISVDPHPPRSIDETIPAELERICLKAISKRTSDRYASGELMAGDLEAWLKPVSSPLPGRKTDVQVVPKGLRSFDANDADFFLDLLPGQRTRDGLPESVAFWKERIEQTDPEQTFTVGLIYGPSGCGKSSLVKAGLLPHLSKDVIAVYLEATPEDTELRILRGLRKRVESLDSSAELQGGNVGWTFLSDSISTGKNAHPTPNRSLPTSAPGLTETILHLRRGQHQKIVIIIDQFEQWLHAHRAEPDAELVRALRQCDGVHVQAIVMIRDDFAMAAARFMQALDVSIVQGQNFATVDLFEIDHAKNVLLKFGQAFGKLPANRENLSADENQFVSDIAHGLSQDSKVVSVRLSLFAEMIKTKRWMPETLQAVGGTEGIGVNFLEETFSSPQANPRHRLHATAARAVLNALLPELGSDIKGHMRSQQEVLEASGYQDRPTDFTDLLRILDGELRLITPTDPEGDSLSGDSSRNSSLATRYYQLTHDYLVPSLRDWLTLKQRETKKGRAELKLAERAAVWNANKENKQLPTLFEWLQIRRWTDKRRWTSSEQSLMQTASRVHLRTWGSSVLAVLVLGAVIGFLFQQQYLRSQQEKITVTLDLLQKTLGPAVPVNIEKLTDMKQPDLILMELQRRFAAASESGEKLSLAFALASFGQVESTYLISQIDSIEDRDTGNLMTALRHDSAVSVAKLTQAAGECSTPELYRRKSRLALAALGAGDTVLPIDASTFEGRTDHGLRTCLIDEFPRWEFDSAALTSMLQNSESPALRSAVCLGWGQIPVKKVSADSKSRIAELASKWFTLGDSSTHSAVAWLLHQWELPKPSMADTAQIVDGRNWYVNSQGTTFVRITPPPVEIKPLINPLQQYREYLTQIASLTAEEQNQPNNRYGKGKSLFVTGQYELALAEFDVFLKMELDESMKGAQKEIIRLRLLTLAKLKRNEDIEAAVAEWRASDPDTETVDYVESLNTLWLGRREEAVQRLEQRLATAESADRATLYNLACTVALFAENELATADEKRAWTDRALALLERWSQGPEIDRSQMQNDTDLMALHTEPRFVDLAAERSNVPEQPYWLANREVTRGEFEAFINDKSYQGAKPTDPENAKSDENNSPTLEHPAQTVSWYDAVMFCNWLSAKEGRTAAYRAVGKEKVKDYSDREYEVDKWEQDETADGYRLPKELEWEYACRAGSETKWSCGNDESFLVNYCQTQPSKLTAVCSEKLPNAWGLHDVHGNVGEWCWDKYSEQDTNRVLRGGSFNFYASNATYADRGGSRPVVRNTSDGFRVGRTLPPVPLTALPPAAGGSKFEN